MSGGARPSYGAGRASANSERKRRGRPWWHYVIGISGLLMVGGSIWGAHATWFSVTHVRTTYARVSGMVVTLSPKGDTRVKKILVRTGDQVKKGQAVALLDNADLEAEVERAQANLAAQDSELARAEQDLEMTIRQTAASVEEAEAQLAASQGRLAEAEAEMEMYSSRQPDEVKQAEAEVGAARAELARLESGPRPQEIAQAEAEVAAAQAELGRAIATLGRMERLEKEGAASAQALDTARTEKEVAEASLEAARQRLSLLESGSRPEDIEAARQAVRAAEAALAVARGRAFEGKMKEQAVATRQAEKRQAAGALRSAESSKWTVQLKEQDVLARRAAVAQAKAGLDSAEARLSDAELRSTENGVVVRGPGRSVHEGEVVTKGMPVVTVASTEYPLWISASVSELYIDQVREGQPALIRIDAFRGRWFKGKVEQVGGATEFQDAQANPWMLQQVPIKLSLDRGELPVIPGMSCRVWIDIRQK
jgi:multidrug resistance efflux pump